MWYTLLVVVVVVASMLGQVYAESDLPLGPQTPGTIAVSVAYAVIVATAAARYLGPASDDWRARIWRTAEQRTVTRQNTWRTALIAITPWVALSLVLLGLFGDQVWLHAAALCVFGPTASLVAQRVDPHHVVTGVIVAAAPLPALWFAWDVGTTPWLVYLAAAVTLAELGTTLHRSLRKMGRPRHLPPWELYRAHDVQQGLSWAITAINWSMLKDTATAMAPSQRGRLGALLRMYAAWRFLPLGLVLIAAGSTQGPTALLVCTIVALHVCGMAASSRITPWLARRTLRQLYPVTAHRLMTASIALWTLPPLAMIAAFAACGGSLPPLPLAALLAIPGVYVWRRTTIADSDPVMDTIVPTPFGNIPATALARFMAGTETTLILAAIALYAA